MESLKLSSLKKGCCAVALFLRASALSFSFHCRPVETRDERGRGWWEGWERKSNHPHTTTFCARFRQLQCSLAQHSLAAELHAVRMDLNTKRGGWVRRCRVADDGVAAEGLEKTEGTSFDSVFTPFTCAVGSFFFRPSTHPLSASADNSRVGRRTRRYTRRSTDTKSLSD